MEFGSFNFFLFTAAVIILYFVTPKKFRWVTLLVGSYFYYYANSEKLVIVLLIETAVSYFAALRIDTIHRKHKEWLAENAEGLTSSEKKVAKAKSEKQAKVYLIGAILIDLGLLLYLKYFNFFAGIANRVLPSGLRLSAHSLLLPIGISFYTLQAIGYLLDVYRGRYAADRHFGKFMLFMSWFPQIIQGPIARHNQLAEQLFEGHSFDYSRFTSGLQLVLWGLMKKLIIADRIAIPVNYLFDNSEKYTGSILFLAAAMYGIQVYTDFSGGMDMARGISQILGIELDLNFRQPYFAGSIEEFWRRWHITLGSWMRDYVFYPLSLSKSFGTLSKKSRKLLGNFVGKRLPAFLSMFVVYFLVGLWHGANLKYIVYGLWNGIFIMSSILLEGVYEKLRKLLGIDPASFGWKIFGYVRTFVIVSFGRFFPRAVSTKRALNMMRACFFQPYDISYFLDGRLTATGLNVPNWIVLVIFILILLLTDVLHEKNVRIRESIASQFIAIRWLIYLAAIAALLVFGIYGPTYDRNAFIYGNF